MNEDHRMNRIIHCVVTLVTAFALIGCANENRVGPGQLLVGQVAVFVLPCLNCGKALFDDKSASSSGVEPGGQAQAVAPSSSCGPFSDRLVQSDRQLSYSHPTDGSTRFLPR